MENSFQTLNVNTVMYINANLIYDKNCKSSDCAGTVMMMKTIGKLFHRSVNLAANLQGIGCFTYHRHFLEWNFDVILNKVIMISSSRILFS